MKLRFLLVLTLALGACDGKSTPSDESTRVKLWEDFSGTNALRHTQKLVDFGPRPPGTEAIEKAREYISEQLKTMGWNVTRQTFMDSTPQGAVTFVNLIATFGGEKSEPSFLLCSHYDTKVFEAFSFVGANDGGSSNGVLLEMARVLASQPSLARKVELVFFDGEEAYVAFTATDGFFGSRYFAKQLAAEGKAKQFHRGILFDMVGDRDLTITLSPDSPSEMAADIFAAAEALKVRKHFTYAEGTISDDHTQLNAIGIPVIDLIDFDYPAWHTPGDTMDQLSAESLGIVGAVATRYLVDVGLK